MATNETKIVITAKSGQAESALISLGRHVDGVSNRFSSFSGILGSLSGALAGALSISAFGAFIKNSIDAADRLDELSQQTGTTVEQLAGLKYAAEQNGASLESVAKGAAKISAAMADKPELFERFGITAKDSTGALIQLADVFAGMPDGIEKSALATKLFGDRVGGEMVLFLNQGTESMRRLIETGQELNPVTTESARAAAQFNDQVDALSASAQGLGIKLSNVLLPALNSVANALLNTTGDPLKDLNIELETIRRRIKTSEGGGKLNQWLFGTRDELKAREAEILQSMEKVRAEMSKPKKDASPGAGIGLLDGMGGGESDADQKRIDAEIERQQAKYDKLSEMAILYTAKEQDRVTWKLAFDLGNMEQEREKAIEHKAWNEDLEASYQQARIDREAMAVEEIGKLRAKELADKQAKDALEIQFMRASFAAKKSMRIADVGNALDLLAKSTAGMAYHSKTAFEINKVASIASIMVKAPKIITDAYDAGAEETGSPWGGAAYAAAAAIFVGAQLSAAQSATFGGGGGVAPAAGGTAGMPASGAADQAGTSPVEPVAPPAYGTEAKPSREVNIYMRGGASYYDADAIRDLLIPALNEAVGDGVTINVRPE